MNLLPYQVSSSFILYVYYGYTCIAKLENQVDWPILRSHSSCVMSEIHAELELLWMELAPTDLHHAEEAKRKWNSARGIVKVRESGERKFRPGDISELRRSDLKYPIMFWKFRKELIDFMYSKCVENRIPLLYILTSKKCK